MAVEDMQVGPFQWFVDLREINLDLEKCIWEGRREAYQMGYLPYLLNCHRYTSGTRPKRLVTVLTGCWCWFEN